MLRLNLVALVIGAMALGAVLSPGKAGAAGGDTLVAASGSLVQCVAECVKRSGKDEQETCEYKCAAGTVQSKPVDCMGDFKAC